MRLAAPSLHYITGNIIMDLEAAQQSVGNILKQKLVFTLKPNKQNANILEHKVDACLTSKSQLSRFEYKAFAASSRQPVVNLKIIN